MTSQSYEMNFTAKMKNLVRTNAVCLKFREERTHFIWRRAGNAEGPLNKV